MNPERDNKAIGDIAESRMTVADVLFQILRPIVYSCMIAFIFYDFDLRFAELDKIWIWLISFGVVLCIYLVGRLVVRCIFGLRHIGGLDELQLYDMSRNKTIITAVLYFDKFEDGADAILKKM